MRRPATAVMLGVIIGGCVAVAAQQRDTFRSRADVVQLDVVVTGKDGRPVTGLTQDDFEIREDNKPVTVAAFREVNLPDGPANVAALASGNSATVTGNNQSPPDGRLIVIVVDDLQRDFSAGRLNRAKQIAVSLISRLGPTDQAALMATSGTEAYQVGFTTDKARLLRPLEAHSLSENNTGLSRLEILTQIAERLESVTNRRKIIALISEGKLDQDATGRSDRPLMFTRMEELFNVALRANVAVFCFDPRYAAGLDRMAEMEKVADGTLHSATEGYGTQDLQSLAENTGGMAAVRTNMFDDAVKRMYAESVSYYLIGYYAASPGDGKRHRIKVTTRHPGLTVKAKSGYVARSAN